MKMLTKLFSIYLLTIGISAIYGGWVIVYTDFMHFPPDLLLSTPFDSFTYPALILVFIVGGPNLLAAYFLWTKNKFMYEASATAGFGLLIWMLSEVYMIPSHHPIQIVYLGFAILTLIVILLLQKYLPISTIDN